MGKYPIILGQASNMRKAAYILKGEFISVCVVSQLPFMKPHICRMDHKSTKFFPDNGVQIKDFIYAMNFDPVANTTKYVGGHQMDRFMTFKKANNCDNGPWGFLPSKSVAGAYVF